MRFYVYCIHDGDGFPVYVGKGTGRRFVQQRKNFRRPGYITKRFHSERAAFAYERKMVEELRPSLNQTGGGGGSWVRKPAPINRRYPWEYEMERVGQRRYTARALLRFDLSGLLDASKIDAIRQVANGPRL